MANEARPEVEGPITRRTVTVADGTALAKGTLMVFEGGTRTAVAHASVTQRFAGITVREKEASDGYVEVPVQTGGVAEIEAAGQIHAGDWVVLSATANQVRRININGALSYQELNALVGVALQNAAAAADKIDVSLGRPF